MALTTNFELYKPTAGETGWGDELNANFDTIDALLYSNHSSIDGHTGTGSNKHNADQIRTSDGSNVQAALTGKSDTGHTHSEYALQADLTTVENTLDLLLPDLSTVNISVQVTNVNGGLRISFGTSPSVHFTSAEITVDEGGYQAHLMTTSANVVYIPGSDLSGVEDGDTLSITVTLYSGLTSKDKVISHTFSATSLPLENRVEALETQLTLGGIIDAFAQDEDALTALANVLHSSNTLAQKVADLM